jgi:hypothetical protein
MFLKGPSGCCGDKQTVLKTGRPARIATVQARDDSNLCQSVVEKVKKVDGF